MPTARLAQGDDLKSHRSESGPGHSQFLGGGIGEIDHAPLVELATIVDAHNYRLLGVEVHDSDQSSEGQCRMTSSHGKHIESLAAGCAMAVQNGAVPGGDAS